MRPFRALRRAYIRGLIKELELAMEAETRRYDRYAAIMATWRWQVHHYRSRLERDDPPAKRNMRLAWAKDRRA